MLYPLGLLVLYKTVRSTCIGIRNGYSFYFLKKQENVINLLYKKKCPVMNIRKEKFVS